MKKTLHKNQPMTAREAHGIFKMSQDGFSIRAIQNRYSRFSTATIWRATKKPSSRESLEGGAISGEENGLNGNI